MCTKAHSGAWAPEAGSGQTILKYESTRSTLDFDGRGRRTRGKPASEAAVSQWREQGLSDQLTVQTKVSVVEGRFVETNPYSGEDLHFAYWGQGPIEVGARYAVVQGERTAMAVYGGAIIDGVGRNIFYAPPGRGSVDWELRVLAGRSMQVLGREAFGEVQAARLFRSGVADEMRVDATVGVEVARAWQVLIQTYAGRAERDYAKPLWLKGEASIVRRLGSWRVQAGWRQTLTGRHVPADRGPVVAVWRDF
ncbi:hypothetical protein [Caulobacter sp. NIBR2454]|uniref:hypothetical protein n=1 Tax=Caulobacter sp. NIBR2454 TaxID=3015996 RepID=UPI0022B68EB2|nr:hypothetical protein [Caulobacter sp. NIBR2454]